MKKRYSVRRLNLMRKFSCLADKCWDNCCLGWAIDVDTDTLAKYEKEAPELLEKVQERSDKSGHKMCYHKDSKDCICLNHRLCLIHKNYGEGFLPNICYYFPNIYKKIGDEVFLGTNLACPASVDLILYSKDKSDFEWHDAKVARMRKDLVDCSVGFQTKSPKRLFNIHKVCMNIVNDPTCSANEVVGRLILFCSEYDKIKHRDKINRYGIVIHRSAKHVLDEFRQNNKTEVDLSLLSKIIFDLTTNFRSDNNNYFKAVSSIIQNVLSAEKGELSEELQKLERKLQKLIETSPEESENIHFFEEKLEALKKMELDAKNRDYAKLLTNVDNIGRPFVELQKIWNSKNGEVDDIFKNYIRGKLCENIFPIGTSFLDVLKDMYLIVIPYLLIRLAILCSIDKDGNIPHRDTITKIFESVNKCFYAKRNQDLLDICTKTVKHEDLSFMINALSNI